MRVARGCCQALMAKKGLHVTQVGSALVEQQRRGRMPKGMSGNDRHPSALAGELDPGVECLVAKGSAVPARKDERRSREVYSPTPQPHALDTFQESEPFLERIRQFFCEGQITKGAAFDLEACSDNHPAGFADEPVHRKPRPLVKPATGEKERGGEVVCQVSKVAAAILAQLAQELAQLRSGVVTQLGFLGRELGSRALGEWICGTQDVIEQREGRFNLEVMGSAPAANIATRPDNGSDCLGNQRPDQGQTRYLVPKAKTETALPEAAESWGAHLFKI